MKNNEKIVIGYRDKVKITNGNIVFVGVCLFILAFGLSAMILFANGEMKEKLGGVAICFVFFLLTFFLFLGYANKQKKIYSYPDEVIYFEDGNICINENEIIKLNILDIKNIKETSNDSSSGTIIIVTNENKKYKVVQIKDSRKVELELNDLRVKYLVKESDRVSQKEFEEKLERARNDNNVKKIEFDDLLFVYDDKIKEFKTITTVNGVKIELVFQEDIEDNQRKSIDSIRKIINNFGEFYKKVLRNLADDLIENANEWNDSEEEFTKEEFIRRIDKNYIQISITEEEYEIFFDDDGIFLGHTIVYNGNIENEEFYTDIAG